VSAAPLQASRGAVLAIDHGAHKTGFAAADGLRIAVRPLEVWRGAGASDALLEHVLRLVAEREVRTVLVGWPCRPDGAPGPRALEVGAFLTRLAGRLPGVELLIHDERLSTKAAEELLREAGIPRRKHRELRDSWSALVVLRDWIASGEPRVAPPPPGTADARGL
jgi:putative holliday junction resolvase